MKSILVIDENRDIRLFDDIRNAAEFIASELRWQDTFCSEYLAFDVSGDEPVSMTNAVNGYAKDYWLEDKPEEADYYWHTLNNMRD